MIQSFAIHQLQRENIEDKYSLVYPILKSSTQLSVSKLKEAFYGQLSPNTPLQHGHGGKRVFCPEKNILRCEGEDGMTTGKVNTKSVSSHLCSPVAKGNFCSTKVTSNATCSTQVPNYHKDVGQLERAQRTTREQSYDQTEEKEGRTEVSGMTWRVDV